MLGRRKFITLLGSAAATLSTSGPFDVSAQTTIGRMRRIGCLSTNTPAARTRLNAFKRGLFDLGWIEGRNVAFEERSASDVDELRPFAAELAALRLDLIFVATSPTLAAIRRATGTVPILFSTVTDPVGQGFVSSLAQPGGNITGFAGGEFELATKQIEILKKIASRLTEVGFIYDVAQPAAAGAFAQVETVASSLEMKVSKMPVRNAGEIERAIDALAQASNAGLFIFAGPAIGLNNDLIVKMMIQHRLPAIHTFRYFVDAGGLASYGIDDVDLTRRAASYADRILKGEKPADLPVQGPTKFELILNLKTAKAMRLVIPESVLALADEVIE
jgi:putative ABC transport system substrate-binding protein